MNLAIALTAARYGAATANYAEVLRLLKTTDPAGGKERVCGVRCRDVLTGACLPRGAERRGDPKAASCPPSPTDRASERCRTARPSVCSTLLGGWKRRLSAAGFTVPHLNRKPGPVGERTLFIKETQK